MKVFNIIFCLLFLFFAGLQYNDPDPFFWIAIYLFGAAICWLMFMRRYYPTVILAGMVLLSIYALYKVFDTNGLLDWITKHHAEDIAATMKAEKPWIEESREFFGLLIIITVLAADYFYIRRKKREHT